MYISSNQWGISRFTNSPTDDQIVFNKYKIDLSVKYLTF